jgi:hypothetical protein
MFEKGSVSIRTIKAIKIYSIIALCSDKKDPASTSTSAAAAINYDDFLGQLFFKVNFTGFQQQQQQQQQSQSSSCCFNSSPNLSQFEQNFDNLESGQQQQQQQQRRAAMKNTDLLLHPTYTLKFTFKPGAEHMYENIFSLCLEMGLCTLNEIYDYPFAILFPVFEAINWSRENPCFSWPAYAFDLIGRNDLAILKANSDALTLEQQQTTMLLQQQQTTDPQAATDSSSNMNNTTVVFRQQQTNGNSTNRLAAAAAQQNQATSILTFGNRNTLARGTTTAAQSGGGADDDPSYLSLSIIQNSNILFFFFLLCK